MFLFHDDRMKDKSQDQSPWPQLHQWRQDAEEQIPKYSDAATLATVDPQGKPHSRVILVRWIREPYLYFFTNFESPKAQHILANPNVSLNFYFKEFDRQLRVSGICMKASPEESNEYWGGRSRMKQIHALASKQSSVCTREEFDLKVFKFQKMYSDSQKPIPRPDNWGGFKVAPHTFEFWTEAEARSHKREQYKKNDQRWAVETLAP